MGKDKSILEKITERARDIAQIATDAANQALKAEAPPLKADERSAVYMPLAADGLVSDPMMVPPIAAAPVPRRKRAASRAAKKTGKKARARKTVGRPAGKTATKSAAKRSKSVAKRSAKKTAKKTAKKPTKRTRRA